MKINWKVRFKNKAWLVTFIALVVGFIYQCLGMFDVVPPISQDIVIKALGIVINVLVGWGVIIDPTTNGTNDSTLAMTYEEPKK